MALAKGTKLGPYEVLGILGVGGMGEVYRAADHRLRRHVAIKVLPASFSSDPDRLRRFEQEAQATAALNHPNILALFDTGIHDGAPYAVTELLEGETLREKIREKTLSLRKAIEFGSQIARGLSAAHQKGVIHRDLKPENIFITSDGRAKILDFGLAKFTEEALAAQMATGSATTLLHESAAGTLVGTVGYMAPEQVRGKPVDARSDVFAFGALMYEMLSGHRAFEGATPADTISAILNGEPPPLEVPEHQLPPGLDRIVRHCLEKSPEERFQSARDIAFDLESLSSVSGTTLSATTTDHLAAWHRWLMPLLAMLAVVVAASAGYYLAKRNVGEQPVFQRLTFRRGQVRSARFGPDQQTVVYSAAWDGSPSDIFLTVPNSPDARSLGLRNAHLFAASKTGEAAIGLNMRVGASIIGTLARISLAGGLPREVMENVQYADWGPDGKLAIVYDLNGKSRIEYPIGHLLAETGGKFSDLRVSRDGKNIAMIEHNSRYDYSGSISVLGMDGSKKALTKRWENAEGLAWSSDNKEIWFTASASNFALELYGVSLDGKLRLILRAPGTLELKDIAQDGRVLLARDNLRLGLAAKVPGESNPSDLSWFDYSFPADLSSDGKQVVFSEQGEATGDGDNVVYVRGTDRSPAVRITEGWATSISPDSKSTLVLRTLRGNNELWLVPLGTGEPRSIPTSGLNIESAAFLPDGKRVVFLAKEAGQAGRLYVQDLATSERKVISPFGVVMPLVAVGVKCISPDGKWVVLNSPARMPTAYSTDGEEPQAVRGIVSNDIAVSYTRDGKALFVYESSSDPTRTVRLDLTTGERTAWREFTNTQVAGVLSTFPSKIIQDGGGYLFAYRQVLSDLYVVTGLK